MKGDSSTLPPSLPPSLPISIFRPLKTHSLTPSLPPKKTTNEDLEHLKNQTITVEVNMARLFNHDVKRRKVLQQQQQQQKEQLEGGGAVGAGTKAGAGAEGGNVKTLT